VKRLLLILLFLIFVFLSLWAREDISGFWHYGVNRSPDYCVRITMVNNRIHADFIIWDQKSGSSLVYAKAEGMFISFWEVMLWGKHTRSIGRTKKGQKFTSRWILYDNNKRIQEFCYWGVYRIKSYLTKGSP